MWPGAPASETSRCYCQSLYELSAQSGEWEQSSRDSSSPLITLPIPGLQKQDVKKGLSRTFDPACKVTAALTPPCWTPVYGPQRHFQQNVISNQWPPPGHVHLRLHGKTILY